jgi:hypothetical protein
VKDEAKNSNIEIGTLCKFIGCAEDGESCIAKADGTAACAACSDISTASAVWGSTVTPSDYTCNQIATRADAQDNDDDHKYICEFSAVTTNECVEVYSSADDKFVNCSAMRSEVARHLGNPCALYDNLYFSGGDSAFTPAAIFGLASLIDAFRPFTETSEKVCSQDICGVIEEAKKESAEQGKTFDFDSCVLSKGVLYNSCVAKE